MSPNDGLAVDKANAAIECPFFRAVINPQNGAVRSLIEKRTGRELLEP